MPKHLSRLKLIIPNARRTWLSWSSGHEFSMVLPFSIRWILYPIFLIFLLTIFSKIAHSQNELDPDRRCILTGDTILNLSSEFTTYTRFSPSAKELELADSLLLICVQNYNRKIEFGDLSDHEWFELQKLDSILSLLWLNFNANGKTNRHFKKLNSKTHMEILAHQARKDSLLTVRNVLWSKKHNRTDKVITGFSGIDDGAIDLKQYYRQFFCYINNKGEKEIYVNCICSYEEMTNLECSYQVLGGGDL